MTPVNLDNQHRDGVDLLIIENLITDFEMVSNYIGGRKEKNSELLLSLCKVIEYYLSETEYNAWVEGRLAI